MPLVAIVLGVLVCIWSFYGAVALNLVWLVLFAGGICAIVWGWRRAGYAPWSRRGPPPSY